MIKLTSAPVRWRMGQPLLPEHLEAQEQSLRDELVVRTALLGLPRHGVARLRWDEGQLERGVVRLADLTLVLPSGRLVDIPGNCEATAFDLENTGLGRVSLFLTLAPLPGEAREPLQNASSIGPGSIDRVIGRARLVSSRTAEPEAEVFHLADLVKDTEGRWAVSEDYLPPALGVRSTPFFRSLIERFENGVDRFIRLLAEDIRDHYLAGHVTLAAQQGLRMAYKLKGWLRDVGREIDPHPYELFRALRDFYVDVCVYRQTHPLELEVAYTHTEMAPGFQRLLEALEPLMEEARASRASYAPFERREGALVCAVPRDARKSRQLFLLVRKASVGQQVDLGRVKLASPSRLPLVHQRALRGVPFERIDNPPFQHDFSVEVELYGLALGEEWDHVVNEGVLATYARADLDEVRLFLYWR